MKIVHICMVDEYSEGWSYHRNVISEKNKEDGHDVTIITTKYSMGKQGESVLDKAGSYYTKSGVKIVRLPDAIPIPKYIQDRLHWTKNLYEAIDREKPDVIMVHNLQFINIGTVIKYKENHVGVRLYGDTHADKFNSIGKFSGWSIFIHKKIWGPILRKYYIKFDTFFYISQSAKIFFTDMYKIDMTNAIFAPLPAPRIDKKEKAVIRRKIRARHNIQNGNILLVHSGKLTAAKKTMEILEALKKSNLKCSLLVIGDIPKNNISIKNVIESLPNAEYLGWKSADELREYLAAADLYLQPGTQSVTMQNALAVGTPVMIYPYVDYQPYMNGCEFLVKTTEDICSVFETIVTAPEILKEKSEKAYEIAKKYFDLDISAGRLYI